MSHFDNLTTILRSTEPGALVVGNAGDVLECQGGVLWKPVPGTGGGTGLPFTNVRYVNKGTATPGPDQTGSATAPFATIAQAVAALPNAQGSLILVCPGDYRSEGPLAIGTRSIAGMSVGDDVTVLMPALVFAGASSWVGNADCSDGLSGDGNVVCTFVQLGNVSGTLGIAMYTSTGNGTFVGESLLAYSGSSLGWTTITFNGTGQCELYASRLLGLTEIAFGAPGGVALLDTECAADVHVLAVSIVNGVFNVIGDQAGARLTVTVPALAAGELGYADVDTSGTELENIATNDVVVGNPVSDLHTAGAGGGAYIGCRVSAANTIRCTFLGALAGGGASFNFGYVTKVIVPPG